MAERSASLNTSAVAIVTGASQGIGRAASFVSLGISQPACLWLEIGEARKNRMRSGMASAEAMAFYVDLGGPQAAEAIVSGTLERFGRIDAWLNIAGPWRRDGGFGAYGRGHFFWEG